MDGKSIITKYGIALSLDEWVDLKQYVQAVDQQLASLQPQAAAAATRRVSPTPRQNIRKQNRANIPYKRANTAQQNRSIPQRNPAEQANQQPQANNISTPLITLQDLTTDELFNRLME